MKVLNFDNQDLTSERHEIYSALLAELPMNSAHKGNLSKRGLPAGLIENNSYGSLRGTNENVSVATTLANRFGERVLERTPGFLRTRDRGWSISASAGLLIPCRNQRGQIIALKVRRDEKADESKSKYFYLSSANHGGTGPGSPVHIPLSKVQDHSTVRVTEGELKADIATHRTGILTISIPGVTSWRKALPELRDLGAKTVLVALDSDIWTNKFVAIALAEMVKPVRDEGYELIVEKWNPETAKGIDDLLVQGYEPERLTDKAIDELLLSLNSQAIQPEQDADEGQPCVADLAEDYLFERNYFASGQLKLKFWRDGFYAWESGCYREIPQPEFKADIFRWLQQDDKRRLRANTTTVSNMIANIEGFTILPSSIEPGVFLQRQMNGLEHFIALENGILHLKPFESKVQSEVVPHTPDFFNFNKLPFAYDPDATCPVFEKFLAETLPDPEVRQLLQQWFGYNLINDTSHEKIMFFLGEGSNGKSVVATILREVLGDANVSTVGLELFSSKRTVALGETFGKLANVVDEIDHVDRLSEGLIKNFVSGGTITADRKYQSMIKFRATARLTICTNNLPKATDRSDGYWRRVIVIPFTNQILDESKKDRRLKDPAFWRRSNELPGIFNWALAGLRHLVELGRFIEPKVCTQLRDEYKSDSNPAKVFLQEQCEYTHHGQVSKVRLYQEYQRYCRQNGVFALAQAQFAKEVARVFPHATASANALSVSDVLDENGFELGTPQRQRVWKGLCLRDPMAP